MPGVTYLETGPPIWFALGCTPFLFLSGKFLTFLSYAGIVILAWVSVGDAFYSPYNRIDLELEDGKLSVNRDFHQFLHDLSDERLGEASGSEEETSRIARLRRVYELPSTR